MTVMVFEISILHGQKSKDFFYCILNAEDQKKAEGRALSAFYIETGKQAQKPVFFSKEINTIEQILIHETFENSDYLPILGLEKNDLTAL